MVHPDRAGISNNVAGNPGRRPDVGARRAEHRGQGRPQFQPESSGRAPASTGTTARPIRNCGEVGGCTVPNSIGETSAGEEHRLLRQRVLPAHLHASRCISSSTGSSSDNLLNHSTVAYDRWFMGGNNLAAGAQWPQRLWAGTPAPTGGILDTTGGPPLLSFDGNIPYNQLGQYGWPGFGFLVNNRWQFSDDLTWVKGRHTLKSGFEYRYHDFPFRGWAVGSVAGEFHFNRLGTAGFDASGNNLGPTGDPFASFLLGQVQSANQTIPVQPTFREAYTAGWINDEFKVSDKLTLTLGLRFDYQLARTEVNNQYSTFDPNTPNPGAGNHPGAIIFAGSGPGLAGNADVREPPEGRLGAAPRRRLSHQRPERPPRRLRHLLRARRVRPVRRAADPRIPGQRAGAEHDERHPAGVLSGPRLPGERDSAAAVHRPDIRPRDGPHRGGEGWADAAAVPELVHHLRA